MEEKLIEEARRYCASLPPGLRAALLITRLADALEQKTQGVVSLETQNETYFFALINLRSLARDEPSKVILNSVIGDGDYA